MKSIILVLLCLSAVACSSDARMWRPTPFTPAPGVPEDVWDKCHERALGDLGRRFVGPSEAAGYHSWEQDERDCTMKTYLRTCFQAAWEAESASGFKVRPNKAGWSRAWRAFMDAAVDDSCDPDKGGTPRALALARVLADSAEAAGNSVCIPCQ